MATLLLTAVGTAIGGPLGGAVGALIGRQADAAIIGGRRTEGPRLRDLSVQTSSYGAPLPLHFGTMRAAGTVIWSTELSEHGERQGGGKGQPSVTTYSYTASLAVAVASRPIAGIGRVWADGNLLRGAAGDLKAGGTMRVHTGHGDQMPDPLLAQAEGADRCPAYRNLAYVVFEDLDLADFGNRLPSLTFEIIADAGACPLSAIIAELVPGADAAGIDTSLAGFTMDQGSCADMLATLADAVPLACAVRDGVIHVQPAENSPPLADIPLLPHPAANGDDDDGDGPGAEGWTERRQPLPRTRQCGIRYYDPARDYQPGLQRGIGRSAPGDLAVIELPAAIAASQARALAEEASMRANRPRDTIRYRVAEISRATWPGAVVRLPVVPGLWRVDQWEWLRDGVMLDLTALPGNVMPATVSATDAGRGNSAADLVIGPTALCALELPWDGSGNDGTPRLYAALSSASAGWRGAALFATAPDGALAPLGPSGRKRTRMGTCDTILPPASPLLFDNASAVDVTLVATDLALADSALAHLLQGGSRALIGDEIVQFARAEPLGAGRWRLSGLLRGRGGTEAKVCGHVLDERFILLDDALVPLDAALVADAGSALIAAIGLGDGATVTSAIACAGATATPLSPVHGKMAATDEGGLILQWTRRARGAWTWPDLVETPLHEEVEAWRVGYGDDSAPAMGWQTNTSTLTLTAEQRAALLAMDVPRRFHIRQIGKGALSPPLVIAFAD